MSMLDKSQAGSRSVWTDAPTKFVDVGGTKFAYRQLGPNTGVPVIFLNHLAAELDRWDPRVVDGIAAKRRVIVFDNRGVGASEGSTPTSVAAMARDAIASFGHWATNKSICSAFHLAASSRKLSRSKRPTWCGRSSWRALDLPAARASTT